MKAKELLRLFMLGDFTHENTATIRVYDNDDLEFLLDVKDAKAIPQGQYLVYWSPIEDYGGNLKVTPDYTFTANYGNKVYLLKIED